jgi:hypothetical protein
MSSDMEPGDAPHEGLSLRPWRVNPAWMKARDQIHTPPVILDANGDAVISQADWLIISPENARLIVLAVNTMDTGGAPMDLPRPA